MRFVLFAAAIALVGCSSKATGPDATLAAVALDGGDFFGMQCRFLGRLGEADPLGHTITQSLPRLDGLICLDAFAGSGALGFEAASRGAARVVMLEPERSTFAALQKNALALAQNDVEVLRRDAQSHLASTAERYDLIFLDPPFARELLPGILPLAATRLAPGGRIYAESPRPLAPAGMVVLRAGRAGQSHFCLLEIA